MPVPVEVFFLRDGKLAAARREVRATHRFGSASLNELFSGPSPKERQAGLTTALPKGIVWSSLHTGSVELSYRLDHRALAQITYTLLAQFSTLATVKVNGTTYSADDFEDVAPAILIESPVAADSVSTPLHVTGTANTFEATFTVELRTGGRLLDKRTVTATSGSGTRGTFETEIPFKVSEETRADLVAYELSAKDGKPTNKVSVPIGLLP
jgi:germination protein M